MSPTVPILASSRRPLPQGRQHRAHRRRAAQWIYCVCVAVSEDPFSTGLESMRAGVLRSRAKFGWLLFRHCTPRLNCFIGRPE